ncbi:hypothetical protein BROUX41_005904 [Berkeleyomyces rouxiae]|uniref:uncharacterized protein n=1 Tax=Berkeleyomyces rouxiae TaxID=2035830 RepID=UPI003B801B99
MEEPSVPVTLPAAEALLSAWVDFLTIALHTLLYHRGLYPPRTFLTARAFGAVVHQSRHPAVVAWIAAAADAIKTQIRAGAVERVALVLYAPADRGCGAGSVPDADQTPTKPRGSGSANASSRGSRSTPPVVERWVFNTSMFPVFPATAAPPDGPPGASDPAPAAGDGPDAGGAAQINWVDVDEQLRGAVQRVSHAAAKLPPLDEGATFTVAVEMRDDAAAPLGHPQPWVPSEIAGQACGSQEDNTTTPIRSVAAGPLFFECWVEQATP